MIGQTFILIGSPKLVFRLVWRGSIAGIDCVRGVALNGKFQTLKRVAEAARGTLMKRIIVFVFGIAWANCLEEFSARCRKQVLKAENCACAETRPPPLTGLPSAPTLSRSRPAWQRSSPPTTRAVSP